MKPLFRILPVVIALGSPLAHAASGTWTVDSAGSWSDPLNWTDGTIADGSDSTATFTNDLTADRIVTLDTARTLGNLTFGDAAVATAAGWTISGPNILTLATATGVPTITTNALAANKTATISSEITGTQGLTIASGGANGTLTLSGANTYTGTTTINTLANGAHGVIVAHAQAFGTSSVLVNGNLQFSNGIIVTAGLNVANALTLKSFNAGSGRAIMALGAGSTWSGNITIDNSTAPTGGFGCIQSGGTSTNPSVVSGNISLVAGTNTNALVFRNSGTFGNVTGSIALGTATIQMLDTTSWQFSNANNTWGTLSIDNNGANVYVGAPNALSPTGVVTSSTGSTGTLRLNNFGTVQTGYSQRIAGLKDTGTGKTNVTSSQPATLTLDNSANLSATGSITGPITLVKSGIGSQLLAGTNNYTGTTTISGGTLAFGKLVSLYNNDPSKWTTANLVVNSGATLAMGMGGTGEFTTTEFDLIKGLSSATGGFLPGSSIGIDTSNATGGTATYAGVIADANGGANPIGFTKLGANTLVLTGTHTYTGPTRIAAGTLSLSSLNQVNGGAISLGDLTSTGTFQYTGTGETLNRSFQLSGTTGGGGLDQSGTGTVIFSGAMTPTAAGNKTLTLTGSTTGSGVLSGVITNHSPGNLLSVTKTGTGAWTLSGENTYGGTTNIQAGTLQVGSNSAIGTGTLTFNPNVAFSSDSTAPRTISNAMVFGGSGTYVFGSSINTGKLTFLLAGNAGNAASKTYEVRSDVEFQGGIEGTNTLVKTGSATLTISGPSTYGATTISAGTLQIGNGGTGGAPGTGNITNNATLVFNRGPGDLSIPNLISGSGSLIQTGTGKTILSGANTYTGNTTVNAGTLSLTSAFLGNSSQVTVASTAALNLNFTGTDTIDKLVLGGSQKSPGKWGRLGSILELGADRESALITGDGLLDVISGPVVSPAYAAWTITSGLSSGTHDAMDENPDSDGLNNLGEFAFNSDPLSGSNAGKIVSKIVTLNGQQILTLTLPVRVNATFTAPASTELVSAPIDGIVYHIQGSGDLGSFNLAVSEVTESSDLAIVQGSIAADHPLDVGWTYRSFRSSEPVTTTSKGFLRAKVTE